MSEINGEELPTGVRAGEKSRRSPQIHYEAVPQKVAEPPGSMHQYEGGGGPQGGAGYGPAHHNSAYDYGPGPVDTRMQDERWRRHQQEMGGGPAKTKPYETIKYIFFSYQLLFFMLSATVLGIGIWMAADRSFFATITNEPLYAVAGYTLLAGAIIMFIISFLGCCGTITNNKTLLWLYLAVLCVIVFLMVLTFILAIAFRTQIKEAVKDTMKDTLQNYYGVDMYEYKNRHITYAWDRTQEFLHCCGVEDNDWGFYRTTKWYSLFGNTEESANDEEQKPYVPQSCCMMDRFRVYVDIWTCQKWNFGPPKLDSGAFNRALYYDGCYSAGKRYLVENSDILIGFGVCWSLYLGLGIFLSYFLIRRLP